MYFKRSFRLFWQLFSQIVAPPSELKGGGALVPGPPCIRACIEDMPLLKRHGSVREAAKKVFFVWKVL